MLHIDLEQVAQRQLSDYDRHEPGTIFAEGLELDLAQAYRVQELVTQLRERRGERMIGYKVGCTSPMIRQRLGVTHPVLGRLFDRDLHLSGSELSSRSYANLAIEGELAVRLKDDVGLAIDETSIIREIEAVFPVIELHNLVLRSHQPTASELVANNAVHAGFVRGDETPRLPQINGATLSIAINEREITRVDGPELISTIVNSLAWLKTELGRSGNGLKPGQVVLCGSLLDLIPIRSGSVRVTTNQFGAVDCLIEA